MLAFLLLLFGFHPSDQANILVYNPMIGQSHIRFLGNMADILARAGHNVTVLSVELDPLLHPFGIKEKNIHKLNVQLNNDPEIFRDIHTNIQNVWTDEEMKPFDIKDFELFFDSLIMAYKTILQNTTLLESIRNSNFDVAIHEYYELGSTALMEAFGIKKTILASAIGDVAPYTYEITGIPLMASFVPVWATVYDDKMSFWERVDNLEKIYELGRLMKKMEVDVHDIFQSHLPEHANVRKLFLSKSGMILANINEFTQTPRPTSSMVQFVGGGHLYPTKPLSEELDELLNRRKYNILFSLGTFVRICESPLHIKKLFAEAFSSFPDVTFIVKYENCSNKEFDFNSYNNIVSRTWLPQTDLLGDERVNVFITHGGMNSITEGQYRGKPMLSIPIFADQITNTRNAVRVGSTIMLDRRFITKEELVTNLKMLLNAQSSYVKKAKFIQKSLEGREEEYRQKIVKWVELQAEAEKPFDHLILHSRNLSAIELYNLDILGAVIVIVLVILGTSLCLLKSLLSFLKPSTNKTKEQ